MSTARERYEAWAQAEWKRRIEAGLIKTPNIHPALRRRSEELMRQQAERERKWKERREGLTQA